MTALDVIRLSEISPTVYTVPFPGNGHQTRFKEEVTKILEKHY